MQALQIIGFVYLFRPGTTSKISSGTMRGHFASGNMVPGGVVQSVILYDRSIKKGDPVVIVADSGIVVATATVEKIEQEPIPTIYLKDFSPELPPPPNRKNLN